MRRIPVPLVRANQYTLIGTVLLAFALQAPSLLAALALVFLIGVAGGPNRNVVFQVARPLLEARLNDALTDDADAQRFNQALAAGMLGASALLHYALGWTNAAWAVALAVAGVAFVATRGFCIGCVLYYRLPWLRALLARTQRS